MEHFTLRDKVEWLGNGGESAVHWIIELDPKSFAREEGDFEGVDKIIERLAKELQKLFSSSLNDI